MHTCCECGGQVVWTQTVWCRREDRGARICFSCLPKYERWVGPIKRDPGKMIVVGLTA